MKSVKPKSGVYRLCTDCVLKITVNQLETAGPFGLVAAKFSGRKIKKDTHKMSVST